MESENPDRLRKIVIIGPESTGKSTICRQLAAHYQTGWCPEFARNYLLEHGMNYRYEDLLYIARQQVLLEDQTAAALLKSAGNRQTVPFFIDTDLYVMKVWCEFVFGKCHQWILEQIAIRPYQFYLLCNTDLPWTKDELREYPDLASRQQLFAMYKDIMINQPLPWVEISGNNDDRIKQAIHAVDLFLNP